jgi:hypothetical protein
MKPFDNRNPLSKLRDEFDRLTLPTALELAVGMPERIAGRTHLAQQLKSYSVGMKGVLTQARETHFRIQDDGTLTDGARLVRSAQNWQRNIDRQRAAFGRLATEAGEAHDRLLQKRAAALEPPNHPGKAAIDAQLVAHYKSLVNANDQIKAAQDPDIRAALARAPAALCGLSKETHNSLRSAHWEHVDPDAAADARDLMESLQAANTALSTLEEWGGKLVDFKTAEQFEKNTAAYVDPWKSAA